jgi:hypothetical protein
MLTQARLMEVLDCDPETGIFTWQIQPGSRSDMVGKRAGYNGPGRYRSITVDGVGYLEHRLLWLYVHGKFPADQLDHINMNKSDNRIENLREATNSQNQRNRKSRKGSDGWGRLKGAQWNHRDKRWVAQAALDNGKTTYLGSFDTEAEAHAAYCEAAKKCYGEFFNPG